MSRPASNRFYLADLVMAALLCGLVMALITSARSQANAGLVFFLICVVALIWSVFRAGARPRPARNAAVGSSSRTRRPRFRTPVPIAAGSSSPGTVDPAWKLMLWRSDRLVRLPRGRLGCPVHRDLRRSGQHEASHVRRADPGRWRDLDAPGIARRRDLPLWPEAPRERPCEVCGEIIPLEGPAGPKICPQCRVRHLRPEEAKRQRSRDQRVGLWFLVMLAILVAFLFPRPAGSGSGLGSWIGFLLIVLGIAGGDLRRPGRMARDHSAMATSTTPERARRTRDGPESGGPGWRGRGGGAVDHLVFRPGRSRADDPGADGGRDAGGSPP